MAKQYDIVGKRKIYFSISLTLMMIAVVFSIAFGVKVDIQFKGGTLINYSYAGTINVDEFKATTEEILGLKVTLSQGTDLKSNLNTLQISLVSNQGVSADKQFELSSALTEKYADNALDLISSSDVKPSAGKEFFQKCLVAVMFAAILLTIYIAWRFKRISGWSAGVMAVVALVHDIIMVFATFVIFQIPINANFMAVVLTILGYSVNDTIVIYDRIRENKKNYGNKITTKELVNISINQSLTRTLSTTITTVLSMVVISIVAVVFNVNSILSFSFPLIIGMVSGVYSSICIACPLWVMWDEHKAKKKAR